MILPLIQIPELSNMVRATYGIDSRSSLHFEAMPDIEYKFNSRGFRDSEWPNDEELVNAIWCVGDSFTLGLGSRVEDTWPSVLAKETGRRTINISMDGASNDWIARQVKNIATEINPNDIVIQWSYWHRRERTGKFSDIEKRMHYNLSESLQFGNNVDNFVKNIKSLNQFKNIIHSSIPGPTELYSGTISPDRRLYEVWKTHSGSEWPSSYKEALKVPQIREELNNVDLLDWVSEFVKATGIIEKFVEYNLYDYARDGHHYGLATSQSVVAGIKRYLKGNNK